MKREAYGTFCVISTLAYVIDATCSLQITTSYKQERVAVKLNRSYGKSKYLTLIISLLLLLLLLLTRCLRYYLT